MNYSTVLKCTSNSSVKLCNICMLFLIQQSRAHVSIAGMNQKNKGKEDNSFKLVNIALNYTMRKSQYIFFTINAVFKLTEEMYIDLSSNLCLKYQIFTGYLQKKKKKSCIAEVRTYINDQKQIIQYPLQKKPAPCHQDTSRSCHKSQPQATRNSLTKNNYVS